MSKCFYCEGCAYDTDKYDDGGCESYTERPFICDNRKGRSEMLAVERAIKEHEENIKLKSTIYLPYSGACGKYIVET